MTGRIRRALGLMSGTSMDGIDVALIETDGEEHLVRGASSSFPYSAEQRAELRRALDDAKAMMTRAERPGCLAAVEQDLTDLHAAAVCDFLTSHGLDRATVDVIGFHGHTVLHNPRSALTVQIGDGPRLAHATGIDVVYDLRAADMAAGGQGAPLASVYHRALVANRPERPVAVLNLGGVANLTWIGADGRLIAFDTGPGNALLDDWVSNQIGAACDEGGKNAMAGTVSEAVVHDYLSHPFFAALPPKSLDRNAFDLGSVRGLSLEEGAATLAAFTASAVARAREHLPEEPHLWIVTGGGRKNRALMAGIAGVVENAVVPAEAAGINGDSVEAEAWAYLAVRSLEGLPITFPGTTGVPRPMTGGVLARA